jgi:hypothetical protein
MRQAQDHILQCLLGQARAAALTGDDLALIQKVAKSLLTPELEGATAVVKLNIRRHHVNRVQMEHFAQSRSQRIYIFPAQHNQVAWYCVRYSWRPSWCIFPLLITGHTTLWTTSGVLQDGQFIHLVHQASYTCFITARQLEASRF